MTERLVSVQSLLSLILQGRRPDERISVVAGPLYADDGDDQQWFFDVAWRLAGGGVCTAHMDCCDSDVSTAISRRLVTVDALARHARIALYDSTTVRRAR